MLYRNLILVIFLASSSFSLAEEERLPPLTEQTLTGIWEAVSERSVMVYVMEFSQNGKPHLISSLPGGTIFTYQLVKKKIRDGDIELLFEGKHSILSIKGKGYGDQKEGLINAVMIVDNLNNDPRPLKFSKPGMTKRWYELSTAAMKELERQRDRK